MPLFRAEALGAQDRLYGDVLLVPPLSWQVAGYFLLASVLAAAIFLSLASHQRVTIATGRITTVRGSGSANAENAAPRSEARLEGILDIPAETLPLIADGEHAQVAIDAFPFRTFGTIDARVRTISDTTSAVIASDGRRADVFRVAVSLGRHTIAVDGHPQPLRPGMAITARIETGRRSLLAWLLDPMRASARR